MSSKLQNTSPRIPLAPYPIVLIYSSGRNTCYLNVLMKKLLLDNVKSNLKNQVIGTLTPPPPPRLEKKTCGKLMTKVLSWYIYRHRLKRRPIPTCSPCFTLHSGLAYLYLYSLSDHFITSILPFRIIKMCYKTPLP